MMMDFLKEVGTTEVARDSLKIEVNNGWNNVYDGDLVKRSKTTI